MKFALLPAAAGALALAGCNSGAANNAAAPVQPVDGQVSANAAGAATPASVPTDWQTTASGLRYRRLEGNGSGPKPTIDDVVTFHYVGTLMDGTEFDSSLRRGEPLTMPLSGVIRGWQEGVPFMSVGDVYEFEIPGDLGYGERGSPPVIPPNATLRFRIGLVGIVR